MPKLHRFPACHRAQGLLEGACKGWGVGSIGDTILTIWRILPRDAHAESRALAKDGIRENSEARTTEQTCVSTAGMNGLASSICASGSGVLCTNGLGLGSLFLLIGTPW